MRHPTCLSNYPQLSYRWLSCLALAGVCLIDTSHAADESRPKEARPNIVFLMADDQATYSMGCYGTPAAKTPNLDRLAAQGMVFDSHYDTTAICMASRANVMTGKYEFKTGCNFEHGPLLQEHWNDSYPMQLRQAGYHTAFAGKFGFVVAEKPGANSRLPSEDFDRWGGGPGQTSYDTKKNKSMAEYADRYPHSTLSYGAFGRDFVQAAAQQEQPFCLSISFKAPHHPVQPDPRFNDVYAETSLSKPANYGRTHGQHFSKQSRQGRQYERFESWHYADDYQGVMRLYYQQIYAIDMAVGMIREAIETAGVAENTVIIYTSDNGFLCGSHGYGSKVLPYEEASRVPLIVYDPRHPNSGKGLRCQTLTGNVDFQPTILDLAGLSPAADVDGRSLLRLYDDPAESIHDWLPLINVWGPNQVHSLGVVTKDWKYIYWPYAGEGFTETEEVYHTATDPLELVNLVQEPPASSSSDAAAVTQLGSSYDQLVVQWKHDAVDYHNYRSFGVLFDRRLDWQEKQTLIRKDRDESKRKR